MEQKKEEKPLLMPGPKFNAEEKKDNWFSRHSQKIIPGVIAVLIILGGYFLYQSYSARRELLKPTINDLSRNAGLTASSSPAPSQNLSAAANQTVQAAPPEIGQTKILETTTKTSASAVETSRTDSGVKTKAGRGSGKTHLARAALADYLRDKDELENKLLPEQKIYIEDYLQKHAPAPKTLHPGDETTFDNQLINDAITKAQTLNQNQIKNLHKYVLLVPSLT